MRPATYAALALASITFAVSASSRAGESTESATAAHLSAPGLLSMPAAVVVTETRAAFSCVVAGSAGDAARPAGEAERPGKSAWRRTWFWVALGGTIATGIATGIVIGVLASPDRDPRPPVFRLGAD